MKKNITIHDLARVLDIDSSTVSRALNDSSRVGEKTKEKVKAMAKEMGYQRNLMASNLRNNKTMTIGIVVPFISRYFLSEAIDGIEQIASENGYRVIISQSRDDLETEKKVIEGLYMNRIDGLLISPTQNTKDGDHLKVLTDNDIPVILFDRYYKESNLSKVVLEDRNATYEITTHLINHNRKKIFHFAGNLDSAMYQERCLGYKNALLDNNLEFDESFIKRDSLNKIDVLNEIKSIFEDKYNIPDAIVCANDLSALAVMKYIDEETNLSVPIDIAVTGFSNSPASDIIKPGLTSVNQHPQEMGKSASRMLFNFIDDNDNSIKSSKTIAIKASVVFRGSSN